MVVIYIVTAAVDFVHSCFFHTFDSATIENCLSTFARVQACVSRWLKVADPANFQGSKDQVFKNLRFHEVERERKSFLPTLT